MGNKEKNKYIAIIFICAILIILILIMAFTIGVFINKNNSQNNDEMNNIEQNNEEENDIIKVIIEQEEEEIQENSENNEENNTSTLNEEENVNNQNNNETNVNTTDEKDVYYIKVNNQANVVTIYKRDTNGAYTIPIKAMLCSIGTATPSSGVYNISDKYTWRLLQGNVYGQYAVRITGHILFHSVPYTKKSKNTLEWWEYDKLGTAASLGCVRLTVEDAKWIYDNCTKGTQVEFYSDTDPGPLGTPTTKKISGYSDELKKWDPTDPASNNPWLTYVDE